MTDGNAGMSRYAVMEAAHILGVGTDAVRKRVQRNTIKHERIDGTVYVWLDIDEPEHDDSGEGHDQRRDGGMTRELADSYREQVDAYRDQVEFLRRELERKDAILMTMAQRIPELETAREPAPEPREEPETPTEREGRDDEAPQDTERRSWWRRVFGG